MEATATLPLLLLLLLAALPAPSHGWGVDGHLMVCQIAQGRLSGAAAAAVKDLLPSYAGNNLSSLCSWADDVKFRYPWSSPLHYIDTPDGLCNYSYDRDCKDEDGVKGRCVAGAINNYTSQLLTYRGRGRSSAPQCNVHAPTLAWQNWSLGGCRCGAAGLGGAVVRPCQGGGLLPVGRRHLPGALDGWTAHRLVVCRRAAPPPTWPLAPGWLDPVSPRG